MRRFEYKKTQPPQIEYIWRWRKPYKVKGDFLEVPDNNHYRTNLLKSGKVTSEHAATLNPCLYINLC